jgi:HNH endonuclease
LRKCPFLHQTMQRTSLLLASQLTQMALVESITKRRPSRSSDKENSHLSLTISSVSTPDFETYVTIPETLVSGAIHYGTAFLACALIAGNVWDGYFTTTVDGERIEMENDRLLFGDNYYFHVPSSDCYPIYPSFKEWFSGVSQVVPSGDNVPASNLALTVVTRDRHCQVTGCHDRIEAAHICPRKESDWFDKNGMFRYNLNRHLLNSIGDTSNAITLRSAFGRSFKLR